MTAHGVRAQFLQVPAIARMVKAKRRASSQAYTGHRSRDRYDEDADVSDLIVIGAAGGLFAGFVAVDLLTDLFDGDDMDGECAVM